MSGGPEQGGRQEPFTDEQLLTRFQTQGDTESLILYGIRKGFDEVRLRAAVEGFTSVFMALSFGEQPHYDDLDPPRLLALRPEADLVVRSMTASTAADLRTAGYHLMGVLGHPDFLPDLRAGLASPHSWERVEVVHALARMADPGARELLRSARGHPDPETRQAAEMAQRGWDT